MAEAARAEQRPGRIIAAKNKVYAAAQWKEQKRRAWAKARPTFEGAFGRQFSPERFYYETGTKNRRQFIKVAINYEGKLWAFVKVFNGDNHPAYLYLHPIDGAEDAPKLIQIPSAYGDLYNRVAKLVEKWGRA